MQIPFYHDIIFISEIFAKNLERDGEIMTIDRKVDYLEKARKEGASSAQIERLCAVLWPEGSIPEEAEVIKAIASITTDEQNDEKEALDLEKIVSDILKKIGVPPHILGYKYLRSAIILGFQDEKMMNLVTKKLYPRIAEDYETTPTRVERSIRHAIEVAWGRSNVEILHELFGYTIDSERGKPTNSEFMAMITDRLKLQYK